MSGGANPDVSLVIAVYQREDALELVLISLLNQTFGDFEIVVADDGSDQGIARVIQDYSEQFAHPIRHVWHDDAGFRKTVIVNRAVTHAAGDYLVFIDGDCLLHHRFLERHVKRRHQGGILSGRRVMFDRSLTERVTSEDVRKRRIERINYWWKHAGKIDRWNGFYLPFLHGARNIGRRQYQILGSNFSAHKEDFYRVNGYDERIVGRGLEDNNLCVRFVNAGMVIRTITREAIQYHLYHEADPIPHTRDFIERYRSSGETWTPHGIKKEER
ncbi:MAG: glycosyltransferase [Candidatus Latescibacterota bacterium]|nr:MAG: glycosyltransferase [Candidatus Latescibacterota bacterium]